MGLCGECDVLATPHHGKYTIYYEVKSSNSRKGMSKAKRQYRRLCQAFPSKNYKGVLVTPKHTGFYIRRLR